MTAIDKALELRDQAIAILLAEREQIDAHLAHLGHGQIKTAHSGKKRGPKPKITEPFLPSPIGSSE